MDIVLINKHTNGSLEITEEIEKSTIRHFLCKNRDNFILKLKKNDSVVFKLFISIFNLNSSYYISINNDFIVEYYKFIKLEYITNVGDCCQNSTCVKIKNRTLGMFFIHKCSNELLSNALFMIAKFMKSKNRNIFNF